MQLELLAPAANKEIAKAAINCGADAVYIGGPRFGARSKAGNSVSDIAECVRYAHFFGAKVYVTLNTLLTDEEFDDARRIAKECYECGVDAFIIQDMGWLEQGFSGFNWHASTQCDISSVEKAKFLKNSGISRIVLARELSMSEIANIKANVDVELESFIHGALCVSYSGQCYLSEYMFNRSGNRGECAQACRLPYSIVNERGKVLESGKHLLSLKDLALDSYIGAMADSGVSSFKIEGRLKDACYVKNVTAFYRSKLDAVIEGNSKYLHASAGKPNIYFVPDLSKGFHRPYTEFNIDGKRRSIACIETPKAIGQEIGVVERGAGAIWKIRTKEELRQGDGLCFLDRDAKLVGFGLNEVKKIGELYSIKAAKEVDIPIGSTVYRNQDIAFEKSLGEKSCERKIEVKGNFTETDNAYILKLKDQEGFEVEGTWEKPCDMALQVQKMKDNFIKQMAKNGGESGDLPFSRTYIHIESETMPFIPIKDINNWRRTLLEQLFEKRLDYYNLRAKDIRNSTQREEYSLSISEKLDYRANVVNKYSESFYRKCGVKEIDNIIRDGSSLMKCKYCIKYELRQCPKYFKDTSEDFQQNLFLTFKEYIFALKFDCEREIMEIKLSSAKEISKEK